MNYLVACEFYLKVLEVNKIYRKAFNIFIKFAEGEKLSISETKEMFFNLYDTQKCLESLVNEPAFRYSLENKSEKGSVMVIRSYIYARDVVKCANLIGHLYDKILDKYQRKIFYPINAMRNDILSVIDYAQELSNSFITLQRQFSEYSRNFDVTTVDIELNDE